MPKYFKNVFIHKFIRFNKIFDCSVSFCYGNKAVVHVSEELSVTFKKASRWKLCMLKLSNRKRCEAYELKARRKPSGGKLNESSNFSWYVQHRKWY